MAKQLVRNKQFAAAVVDSSSWKTANICPSRSHKFSEWWRF